MAQYASESKTETNLSRPTIVCGPPGVGKRTLLNKLKSKFPNTFYVVVSHTTRPPRDDEINGTHYHFVTKEEFEKNIKENKFVQHSLISNYYYGTSYQSLTDINTDDQKIYLLDMNVSGASTIKNDTNHTIKYNYLFITTSDGIKTLKKRLKSRNKDSAEAIKKKLKIGQENIEFLKNNPNFFDCVIYNDQDIEEPFYQLTEQFISWYPFLKNTLNDDNKEENKQSDDNKKEEENDDHDDLTNITKVYRASKRQSGDFYNDLRLYETAQSKIKNIFNSSISPIKHQQKIIDLIAEYTDIAPMDLYDTKWKLVSDQFSVIINRLQYVEQRWTLGHTIDYLPKLNMNTIGCVYFAYKEQKMTGFMYYIVGTVRDPQFVQKYFGVSCDDDKSKWDECWDIYFYMKCDTELRGSVQYSRVWSNMLIFGLDSDPVREATENGVWKLNTKSQHFLVQQMNEMNKIQSIEEDDSIVDDE